MDRSPTHRNVLRLQKLHQPLVRTLAANAGLLHAAEGRGRIGHKPAIETDHAEIKLFGHTHAAAEITRVMAAVRNDRMPLDELGIEKELDPATKTLLLTFGAAFESTVRAAYEWERQD